MSMVATVDLIAGVDWAVADEAGVRSALIDLRRVRAWLDSVEVAASRRLAELAAVSPSMFPEQVVADSGRVSLTEASKGFERATTTAAVPELDIALRHGNTSGAHVDVVSRAMRQLSPDQRNRLAQRGDVLALAAASLPRDEFARAVRAEVRRIHDDDGIDRLRQQRRNTQLRTWVDRDTGMFCLRGEFDPEIGARLNARLRNTVETMFREQQPDNCPADPQLKQHHLRALALVAVATGGGSRGSGRIDMSVLIDAETLLHGEHPESVIDCGVPIDLPVETLRRWACCAEITPIIVAADGVSLYLGRSSRTANRAQRRALRAMYKCCAVPGCTAAFDDCAIHHVIWYRNGGPTDIDHLLPVCSKHHHLVHEGGWQLVLDAKRNLTITFPDGAIMTTGPPKRRGR